jgi:hypothetical protein
MARNGFYYGVDLIAVTMVALLIDDDIISRFDSLTRLYLKFKSFFESYLRLGMFHLLEPMVYLDRHNAHEHKLMDIICAYLSNHDMAFLLPIFGGSL